jgi:hypothetical protein
MSRAPVVLAAAIAGLLPLAARGQERPAAPAAVSNPAPPPIPLPPRDSALPPAEEQAKESLSASPRHGEWADVKVPGVATPIRTVVVYPERKEKAGGVIVIHEV